MPQPVAVLNQRDFTGGLNLRADQFQLAPNESPDLLNVDVDPRGGVRLRRGSTLAPISDGGIPIHSLYPFVSTSDSELILGAGTSVSGLSFGSIFTASVSDPFAATTFADAAYITNGTDAVRKFTGAAVTSLGTSWSNDKESPTTGNMPKARFIATHNGHVFLAYTNEGDGIHPNRVRFSHPGRAESWVDLEWFDVDSGADGDEIVGIVSHADHLLVFKRHSVHAVFGFAADSFQVQTISRDVGAVGRNAIRSTPSGVYFYDEHMGLMRYNGRGIDWMFEPLVTAITDGSIDATRLSTVALGSLRNRVWLSVPWGTDQFTTFVLDPSLSKGGAWVRYDLDANIMVEVGHELDGPNCLVTGRDASHTVLRIVEVDGLSTDEQLDTSLKPIASYYRTRWFDAGQPAQKKRWRRPYIVLQGETADSLTVDVFRDYDESSRRNTFTVPIATLPVGGVWGTDVWGSFVWGAPGPHHSISKGSTLGMGNAVQLKFSGPPSSTPWGLDSLSLTFIPRKIR